MLPIPKNLMEIIEPKGDKNNEFKFYGELKCKCGSNDFEWCLHKPSYAIKKKEMNKDEIASKIKEAKPNLPKKEILEKIAFHWNEEGLSTWDGGYDLNEGLREDVVEYLEEEFRTTNPEYAEILRFLLKQEIKNCYESETSTQALRISYDRLADLEIYDDIPLLLSANDDTSFDANCALHKNRLFYKGYENVMKYLKSNEKIDEEVIERIQYYAEYFGYDKEDVKDEERG